MKEYSFDLEATKNDPQYLVRYKSLELQEAICDLHPVHNWYLNALLWIIEWCADRAVNYKLDKQYREVPTRPVRAERRVSYENKNKFKE